MKYKKLNQNNEITEVLSSVYGSKNLEAIKDGEFLRLRSLFMLLNGTDNLNPALYHKDIDSLR